MISIREMTAADEGAVMEMVDRFYHSPAVEHEVDPAVLRRSFQAAVDPAEPLIQGLVLEEDGRPVGYHYMCIGYSAEVGGRYLLLDELYLAPECRGKGYGTAVFRWVKEQYPNYPRIRLEVTDVNEGAIRLYQRLGFQFLDYRQMVLEGDLQA